MIKGSNVKDRRVNRQKENKEEKCISELSMTIAFSDEAVECSTESASWEKMGEGFIH